MSFINWVIDRLPEEDVIDLYFVVSDLKEIFLTDAEKCESNCFDSLATGIANERSGEKSDVQIGKKVY